MDMDFAISCPLVRHWRLISGICPSTRTFDPCFFQTPPRGGSPCIITRPSPPSGWSEDLHLQAVEHAQHTTKPLARRTLRVVDWCSLGRKPDSVWSQGGPCDQTSNEDARGTRASQLLPSYRTHLYRRHPKVRCVFPSFSRPTGRGRNSPVPTTSGGT